MERIFMILSTLQEVFAKFQEVESELSIYCDSRIDPNNLDIVIIEDVDQVDPKTYKQKLVTVAEFNTKTQQWRFPEYDVQEWFDRIEDAKRLNSIMYHLNQIKILTLQK
jgi:hypothetical protein